jgi:hypothetical protein
MRMIGRELKLKPTQQSGRQGEAVVVTGYYPAAGFNK